MILRFVTLIFCALCFFLLASEAIAAPQLTFTWTPPTERANGEPLDPTADIESYALYCGPSLVQSEPYMIQGFTDTGRLEIGADTLLPAPGEHQCAITSIDTNGNESTKSDPVTVEWLGDPKPPTGLSVTAE